MAQVHVGSLWCRGKIEGRNSADVNDWCKKISSFCKKNRPLSKGLYPGIHDVKAFVAAETKFVVSAAVALLD